ncbi:MAG TPA: PAS domain S-box protein [Candidatus Binatia bacterium]|nr:PAS domain S-box protein [Candidatus Binatia bacterium]
MTKKSNVRDNSMAQVELATALEERTRELGERVKELNCLYSISNLLHEEGRPLPELLVEVTNLIPGGWQYPSIACARVLLGEEEFAGEGFRETSWCQRSDILLGGEPAGAVEVYYCEERPAADEGPFLNEERVLLDTIAGQIRVAVTRKRERERLAYEATLLANVSDAIIATDAHLRITQWNPAAERLLGWKGEEVLGRNVRDIVPALSEEERAAAQRHLQDDGFYKVQLRLRSKDGKVVYVEGHTIALKDETGKITGYLSTNRDVSERREAEATLRQSQQRLQAIYDNSMDAILLTDDEARYVEVNQAAAELLGYSREELLQMRIWDVILPQHREDSEFTWSTFLEQGTMSGEHTLLHKDGSLRRVEFRAVANVLPGLHLASMRDITQRKASEAALRRQVLRNEALATVSQAAATAAADPQAVLDTIAQQTAEVLGDACVLTLTEDEPRLQPVAFHHADAQAKALMAKAFASAPPRDQDMLSMRLLGQEEAVFIPVVAQEQIEKLLPSQGWPYASQVGVHSLLVVPLRLHGKIIGALSVTRDRSGDPYSEEDKTFLQNLADRAVLVLHNAQLFDQVQQTAAELEKRVAERTVELAQAIVQLQQEIQDRQRAEAHARGQQVLAEALRDSTAALNETLDLDEVLDRILENLGQVVPHDVANIMLIEDGRVRVARMSGFSEHGVDAEATQAQSFAVGEAQAFQLMAETGEAFAIPDTSAYHDWLAVAHLDWLNSYAGAPIRQNQQTIGFLNLGSRVPGFFSREHATRLSAFADHAAVALRNAQLYGQAQELAVLQERQRLARELHDAVIQSLWSVTLIADVLPDLWEHNQEKGRERLRRLRQLTRGALAELRTVLVELRPGALLELELPQLLQQLAEAAASRTQAKTRISVEGQCRLPSDVHYTVYRVAQEAFNNIIRHARATQIQLSLYCQKGAIELTIEDNGQGFDPEQVRPGHLGLVIMKERARDIDGKLTISSRQGEGTKIELIWSEIGRRKEIEHDE